MLGLDKIASIVTTERVLIVLIVVACIASIEAGIIGGLATRVGSLRGLFRLTAYVANKRTHNTADMKEIHPTRT